MPDIPFVVARNAAKPARVEDAGGKREVSEEGRKSIRLILQAKLSIRSVAYRIEIGGMIKS